MEIVLTILEAIASVALIVIVLLQSGKRLVCPVPSAVALTPT